MKTYYVYILLCSDKSYYTGVTSNLEYRLLQHHSGDIAECYTYSRRPLKLVFFQDFQDVNEAIEREKQIKGWTRRKKKALIDKNMNDLIRFSASHGSTSSP